jgi:hypothetical protein
LAETSTVITTSGGGIPPGESGGKPTLGGSVTVTVQ